MKHAAAFDLCTISLCTHKLRDLEIASAVLGLIAPTMTTGWRSVCLVLIRGPAYLLAIDSCIHLPASAQASKYLYNLLKNAVSSSVSVPWVMTTLDVSDLKCDAATYAINSRAFRAENLVGILGHLQLQDTSLWLSTSIQS